MTKKYIIKLNDSNCIEVAKPNSSILVYKMPYSIMKNRTHGLTFSNRFVVYILYGINEAGQDCIYVGKSKNGIDNRPTSHEDKFHNWTYCYVLTQFQERTFLNDGTIQYLEDKIRKKVDETGAYINKTEMTISNTANASDEEDCDDYLEEAYKMLYAIGLDLNREPVVFDKSIAEENDNGTRKRNHDISPEVMPLLQKLEDYISENFPELKSVKKACYINYELDNRIVGSLVWKKNSLAFTFNADVEDIDDPDFLLSDMTNLGHLGVGNLMIRRITEDSAFDSVGYFLNQVLGKEK